MIVAVVGNRTGWDVDVVDKELSLYLAPDDEIVSGGATGVDTFAQLFAKRHGLKITIFYPSPHKPLPTKYFERNQQIVDMADKMIAFNKGEGHSGTLHAINRAKEKGIPVEVIQ